jgi:tRNA threonylcarbamoyladenosine biosynthesis protein TsaE
MPPADSLSLSLPDPHAVAALGARIAAPLRGGDAVWLIGPLGAGKTTLARGLIAAWLDDAEVEVSSPTYTLVQSYEGSRGVLTHADLYRLKDPAEAEELGLQDALAEGPLVVEWPERFGAFAPSNRLDVRLAMDGQGRRASLLGHGRFKEVLNGFAA